MNKGGNKGGSQGVWIIEGCNHSFEALLILFMVYCIFYLLHPEAAVGAAVGAAVVVSWF